MNFYLTGIEGMPKLLDCCGGEPMKYFSRDSYTDSFQKFYQEHIRTFEAVEQGYTTVIDKDQFLINMAEALVESASARIEGCRSKGKKSQLQMDLNLTMTAFVFPMILEFKGTSSQPLVDRILEAWKKAFPKSDIKAVDFSYIEAGFHKKFCYITTAVCETFGKPDDCRELTVLRNYRDEYLMSQPDGAEMIRTYYDVAPSIVKHIDQRENRREIYTAIWENYLSPCLHLIDENRMEECRDLYRDMVYDLKNQYFFTTH